MSNTLHGYRLHGNDESVGNWRLFDDETIVVNVKLRLKNGGILKFSGTVDELDKWAQVREVRVERVFYEFDPTNMTVTLAGLEFQK